MDSDMVWTDLEEMPSVAREKSQLNGRKISAVEQNRSRPRDVTPRAVVDAVA
jgi:hypothetical protein